MSSISSCVKSGTQKQPHQAEEGIKVAIRMRPLNAKESRSTAESATTSSSRVWRVLQKYNSITQTTNNGEPLSERTNGRTFFTYDLTFGEDSTTRQVYDSVAKGIVDSVVNGLNGTIFAYGQTSSGKTFTMQGSGGYGGMRETDKSKGGIPGIIHMAAKDIFDHIANELDRVFLIRVSFIEIYNEEVRDLLVSGSSKGDNILNIRDHPQRGVFVNSNESIVTDFESLLDTLFAGEKNRAVASTGMNERSSRSHTIFRVTVESRNKSKSSGASCDYDDDDDDDDDDERVVDGKGDNKSDDCGAAALVATLNLVDLAGSESVRHTGATGERQKEGAKINQSLLTLSRVIVALGQPNNNNKNNNNTHINFRDSKLTRILQPSLSGNARMAVICCATPSKLYLEETRSTLQFASRAKLVKTNAQINEVLDDRSLIKKLLRELAEARKKAAAGEGEETMEEMRLLKMEVANAGIAAKDAEEKLHRLKASILKGGVFHRKAISSEAPNQGTTLQVMYNSDDANLINYGVLTSTNRPPSSSTIAVIGSRKKRRQSDGALLIEQMVRESGSPFRKKSLGRHSVKKHDANSTSSSHNQIPFRPPWSAENPRRRQLTNNELKHHSPSSAELDMLRKALMSKRDTIKSLKEKLQDNQNTIHKTNSELSSLSNKLLELFVERDAATTRCESLTSDNDFLIEEEKAVRLSLEDKMKNTLERIQNLLAEKNKQDGLVLMLQSKLSDADDARKSYDEKISSLENCVSECQHEKDDALKMVENLHTDVQLIKDKNDEMNKEKASITGKVVELTEENSKLAKEKEHLKIMLETLSSEKESIIDKLDNLQAENSNLQKQKNDICTAKSETEEATVKLSKLVKDFEEEVMNLKAKLDAVEATLVCTKEEKENEKKKAEDTETKLKGLIDESCKLSKLLDDLQHEKKTLCLEMSQKEGRIENISEEVRLCRLEIDELSKAKISSEEQITITTNELEHYKEEVNSLKSELNTLKINLQDAKTSETNAINKAEEYEDELSATRRELSKSEADLISERKRRADIEEQAERFKLQVYDAKEAMQTDHGLEVSKLKEELANKEMNLSRLETNIFSQKQEVHDLKEEINQLKKHTKSCEEMKTKEAECKINTLQQQLQKEQESREAMTKELSLQKEKCACGEKLSNNLREEIEGAKQLIKSLKSKLKDVTTADKEDIFNLKQENEEIKNELKILKNERLSWEINAEEDVKRVHDQEAQISHEDKENIGDILAYKVEIKSLKEDLCSRDARIRKLKKATLTKEQCNKLKIMKEERIRFQKEAADYKNKLMVAEKDMAALRSNPENPSRVSSNESSDKLYTLENKVQKYEARIQRLEEDLSTVNEECEALSNAESRASSYLTELYSLRKNNSALKKNMAKTQDLLSNQTNKESDFEAKLDEAKKQIIFLRGQCDDLQKVAKNEKSNIDNIENEKGRQVRYLEQENQKLMVELKKVKKAYQKAKGGVDTLRHEPKTDDLTNDLPKLPSTPGMYDTIADKENISNQRFEGNTSNSSSKSPLSFFRKSPHSNKKSLVSSHVVPGLSDQGREESKNTGECKQS